MFIAGLHVDRLKQAHMFVSGTPASLILIWLFFCMSNTRDTFFTGISLIFLPEILLSLLISSRQQLPFSSLLPKRAPLCLYRQSFQRVQSPRNMSHSFWPQFVQLFLSAFAWFAPRLDHLGCHLGPVCYFAGCCFRLWIRTR